MKAPKAALLFLLSFLLSGNLFTVSAQIIQDPTTWTIEAKKKAANRYDLVFHVKLKEGWHIWSLNPGGDGMQVPPTIDVDKNSKVSIVGKPKEKGSLITETMDGVDGAVHMYKHNVDFVQTVAVKGGVTITGNYGYMVCDEHICLPPKTKSFSIQIGKDAADNADSAQAIAAPPAAHDSLPNDMTVAKPITNAAPPAQHVKQVKTKAEKKQEEKTMLMVFLEALLGGILAVLTPCVYSMVPITVSFFTKRSKTRAEGIRNASYYSLSIIIILRCWA